MIIRPAAADDLVSINEIYNHEVRHSTSTFATAAVTPEERAQWMADHISSRHPISVAEVEGVVVGWASLSSWSDRGAYDRSAELSVYMQQASRGIGIGRALVLDVVERARATGLGVILSRISAGEDGSSARFHEALGFTYIGTMSRVGEKFGRILDVALYELHLD